MKGSTRLTVGLIVLTAVAVVLRVRHLGSQILGGDELHLLQVICEHSLREIAGLVTDTDFSIPLALLARVVTEWFSLDELALRAPFLVVGALAPALFVVGTRRWVSESVAWILGFLIAAHPLFIFYSRFVRPYGLCVVLLFLVLVLHDLYFERRRVRFLAASVVLTALAGWIQLVALITAGLIFAASILRALLEAPNGALDPTQVRGDATQVTAKRGLSITQVTVAGVSSLGFTLILLLPALGGIREQIVEGNLGRGVLSAEIVWRNASVLAGAPGRVWAVLLAILGLIGAARMLLSRPALGLWLGLPVLGQLIAILALNPRLLQFSFVLARYVFYALPLALLFVSLGIVGVLQGFARLVARLRPSTQVSETVPREGTQVTGRQAAILGVGLVVVGVWHLCGAYWSIYSGGRGFAHHNVYQTYGFLVEPRYFESGKRSRFSAVPPVYAELLDAPMILEAPPAESFYDNPYVLYQHFHRRPMRLVATGDSFWGNRRLAPGNLVVLGPGQPPPAVPSGSVVILHPDVPGEIVRYLGHAPSHRAAAVYGPRVVHRLREELIRWCGPPQRSRTGLEIYRVP